MRRISPNVEPASAQNVRVVRSFRSSAADLGGSSPGLRPAGELQEHGLERLARPVELEDRDAALGRDRANLLERGAAHLQPAAPGLGGRGIHALARCQDGTQTLPSGLRTQIGASTPWVSSSSEPCATNLPRLITRTSSTVCAISASTWLETSTVRPLAAWARRKSRSQRIP